MSKKFHFKNLDSIRTIAFLSTFLAHAFYTESESVKSNSLFQWAIRFQEIYSFGVPIFFVLSGFLITYLMIREQELMNEFKLGHFYIRRILRIWPVYFLVLSIGFILFPIAYSYLLNKPYEESASAWMYVLFLSNFDLLQKNVVPFGVGLGPTWSVSIEEQFYFIWPIFILFFKKRRFIIPIVAMMIISIVFSTTLHLTSKHTLFCTLYLSVGGLFAYFSFYYTELIKKTANSSPLFLVGSILGIFISIYYYSHVKNSFLFIIIIATLIGFIIVYQCYGNSFEFRSIPFLERLGKYTYGLYLYHVICNFVAHSLIDELLDIPESIFNALILRPIVSLSLCILVSFLSYKYMESFFLQLKGKFSRISTSGKE